MILQFLELENRRLWSAAALKSEVQMDFLRRAMEYVTEQYWTYYIGGSHYNPTDINSQHVTPFTYSAGVCNLDEDAGNMFSSFL